MIVAARSVNTKYRTECPKLEPAEKEFAISRIVGIPTHKSTDIGRPVGEPREREIQPGRNLALECDPVGVNIPRPCSDCVALAAGECRSGKDEYTLLLRCDTLAFINRRRRHER